MPAVSKAQQRLMAIAEHNPSAVYARNRGVLGMSHTQLHDFASGSMNGKPQHVQRDLSELNTPPHPHRNLGHYLHPKKAR